VRDLVKRVFVAGNAGYFHAEQPNWQGGLRTLKSLEMAGILRSSRTAESPPRLPWHLTREGAREAAALWAPTEQRE
jgi:DNA-binding PadR family transcriptional regulator